MLAGSFFWGWLGTRVGLSATLLAAAGTALALTVVARHFDVDAEPAAAPLRAAEPAAPEDVAPELVSVVDGGARAGAGEPALPYRSGAAGRLPGGDGGTVRDVRGRCGAVSWQLFEDVAHPGGWMEVWSVESLDRPSAGGRAAERDRPQHDGAGAGVPSGGAGAAEPASAGGAASAGAGEAAAGGVSALAGHRLKVVDPAASSHGTKGATGPFAAGGPCCLETARPWRIECLVISEHSMNDLFGSNGKAADYSAKDIEVLEGLEPVRRRPGMYIGGTDEAAQHHQAAEILDKAMDEAVAGHASFIEVTLEADNFLVVRDNGRGIPVDPHPKFKHLSALEVILTTLHSGGKFGGKVYETSGGLHGVGASVVNALSEVLEVEVARDRVLWKQRYARGKPLGKLLNAGAVQNRRGTGFPVPPRIGRSLASCRFSSGAAVLAVPVEGVPVPRRADPLGRAIRRRC